MNQLFVLASVEALSALRTGISGNNIEVTPALRSHIEHKILHAAERHSHMLSRCDTHLSVSRNPKIKNNHKCEVVVFAGDNVVRAEESTSSMYASIDLVSHKLARKLRKLKERKERPKIPLKEALPSDIVLELTPPKIDVVKKKAFPMPPQSLDDAKFCLDALDHDFYVFTNQDTMQINVLYKRNDGGLGLIEPAKE